MKIKIIFFILLLFMATTIHGELNKEERFRKSFTGLFSLTARIISVELVNGKLEVVRRKNLGYGVSYGSDITWAEEVWKDIYCAKDGKIVLEEHMEGIIIPEKTIPERYEFNK